MTITLTQPLTSALTRSITQPRRAGGGAPAWAPSSLFTTEPGVAYDLSAASGLYTDSARTTLVSAAGQGIGSVTDISGNGKHATQATTASKPLWQTTYADFDGFDDNWQTAAINFSATDKITVVVGVRKIATGAQGVIAELSSSFGNAGAFAAQARDADYLVGATGSTITDFIAAAAASPVTSVLTASYNLATAAPISYRLNGAAAVSSGASIGARNFLNDVLNIGRRNGASLPFQGRIYRMIVIGRLLTAGETTDAEAWCNATAAAY